MKGDFIKIWKIATAIPVAALLLTPTRLEAAEIDNYYIDQEYPNVVAEVNYLNVPVEYMQNVSEITLISDYRVTSYDQQDGNQPVNVRNITYDYTTNQGMITFGSEDSDGNYGYVQTYYNIVE